MPLATLPDRAILSVTGADARTFLQNLVTNDVETLQAGDACFAALLSPQGKILFDFPIVCVSNESFLLDTAAGTASALAKRLSMYKLRAKLTIGLTQQHVVAAWDGSDLQDGIIYRDPRHENLGFRAIVDAGDAIGDAAAYDAHRIALGVPKGSVDLASGHADFAWSDIFPHEANMDLLHGVSFTKGCYVGQEVVSRMQHRGTTRRRIVRAVIDGPAPAAGSEIRAGETLLGTFGSAAGNKGLANVRIDRLAEAKAAGLEATAGPTRLDLVPPV